MWLIGRDVSHCGHVIGSRLGVSDCITFITVKIGYQMENEHIMPTRQKFLLLCSI